MSKISAYGADSTPGGDFELIGTDPDDTTMASSGTTKKVALSALGYVVTGWRNLVRDYGADPTGATSVSAALASACSAAVAAQPAPVGLVVPPGVYKVTASQDLPYNLVMVGAGAVGGDVTNQYGGTLFRVDAGFTGSYVFGFRDNADHSSANGAYCSGFGIQGSAQTASAVDGFSIFGPAMTLFKNLRATAMSGWGFNTTLDLSASEIGPYGCAWNDVTANSCGVVSGGGINLNFAEDSVFEHVYSIGNGSGPGFQITGCDNTKFVGCQSEWNATHGFYITGDWQYGTGGCQFVGCSTDANTMDGMHIDATWTTSTPAVPGTGPGVILLSGCFFRRDGKGAGGATGTYAGLSFAATTLPVIVTGLGTMPSIGDGGGGTSGPRYGIYFSQASYTTPILIGDSLPWGFSAAVQYNGGTANHFPSGVTKGTVIGATGDNSAPTYGVALT